MADGRWFQLNRKLHRDGGYLLCVGTALYALSGLAVNHIEDWNPNLRAEQRPLALGPLPGGADLGRLEAEVVRRAALDPHEVKGRHRAGPDAFVVFLSNGGEAKVQLSTGTGTLRRLHPRPLLFEANVLHLNHLKGAWTWVADAYALGLFYLAMSGLFMLKGRPGLLGRGKWLAGFGAAVPLGFVAWYHWTR
ncbi:MAG: hypothetical protein EXR79_16700 [Myxococcales bacterium]|nr:hypothetical protein [Myxococcales bacterium]